MSNLCLGIVVESIGQDIFPAQKGIVLAVLGFWVAGKHGTLLTPHLASQTANESVVLLGFECADSAIRTTNTVWLLSKLFLGVLPGSFVDR